MKKLVFALVIMTTASSAFAKVSPASENCNKRPKVSLLSPTNPPQAPKVQQAQKAVKGRI